jgi:hypothetical protein
MSVQEIQSQISRLSREEQLQVEAFLKAQRLAQSPEHKAKITGANRRMEAGHYVTMDELKTLLAKQRPAKG